MGPAYPIALKGRAWIAADTFRITRLETDLVAPRPEIRLLRITRPSSMVRCISRTGKWIWAAADRGSLLRLEREAHLPAPQFNNYLLFAVDDKQKISEPKRRRNYPRILPPDQEPRSLESFQARDDQSRAEASSDLLDPIEEAHQVISRRNNRR